MSAAEWLHQVDEKELMWVLKKFGEERFARKIAAKIKQQGLIHSTGELADLISSIVYKREPGKHPATRSFQAIRIAVNNELGEIESVLPQAVASLNTRWPSGRDQLSFSGRSHREAIFARSK